MTAYGFFNTIQQVIHTPVVIQRSSTVLGRVANYFRSLRKDAKNDCILEMGRDMLGQKARSKKTQTSKLQSTATVEYLYPDILAVYDSI